MNSFDVKLKSIFLILAISFAALSTSAKTTLFVKPGANGNGTSWSNAFGNIQQAIDSAAKIGADVWVAKGVYKSKTSPLVNLRPNVSLYGGFGGTETSLAKRDTAKNATILDGNDSIQVIYQYSDFPDSAAVTIDGFTIQNGNSNSSSVRLQRNTTFNNCIVKENHGNSSGFALYASRAKVKNCIICNNSSKSSYYTVYLYQSQLDSCIISDNASSAPGVYAYYYSTISNSQIINNKNSNTYGISGVYLYDYSSLINSEISNNQGGDAGVYALYSSRVSGCTISNNVSEDDGVLYLYNATAEDCKIFENKVTRDAAIGIYSSSMKRCSVFNNESSDYYLFYSSSSNIANSLFYSNKCLSANSIWNIYSSTIENTTFADNETTYSYGIYMSEATVVNSIIVGNKYNESLGRSFFDFGWKNKFQNSMIQGGMDGDGIIIGTKENAAFNDPENGDYSLSEASFCINRATTPTDSIDLFGNVRIQKGASDMGAIESNYDLRTIPSYGEILYVKAGAKGNGSSWASAFGDVNEAIQKASLDGKKHQIWVAAGTYYGDTLSKLASIFVEKGISLYGGFAGNETSLSARDTAKNRTILDGNKSRGVIFQNYIFPDSLSVVVDGFTIQNGKAVSGGGAYIKGNVTINNCIVKNNSASYYGSAIFAIDASISKSQLINNTYESSMNYVAYLSNCNLTDCIVKDNLSGYCSGINASSDSKISNCVFEGNLTTGNSVGNSFSGSGISNCKFINTIGNGSCVLLNGGCKMTGCVFEKNTGVTNNLVYSRDGAFVDDCKFLDNSSTSSILYLYKSNANRCVIKGNSTDKRLVELANYNSTSSIKNSLICNNVCTSTTDEPIYLNPNSSMFNCTVVRNETANSFIAYLGGTTILKNSIIVDNKTAGSKSGILNTTGSNTIFCNMLDSVNISGNITGDVNYVVFNDPDNGDYSLSEKSYCINAGEYIVDSLDLLGNARIQKGGVDLGAIESQYDKTNVPSSSDIIYVKTGSKGDGSSWTSALGDVSEAVKTAMLDGKKHQVWVAAGTYYGDSLNTATSIYLEKGISLYGGFAGTETSLAQRDTAKNPTILDGKGLKTVLLQTYDFPDSLSVVVDGFVIQNGSGYEGGGVNVKANTTINNCIVKENKASRYGTAIHASKATIKNTQILNNAYLNSAYYTIRLDSCVMDSCIIKGNKTYYSCGINAYNGSVVANCHFEGNTQYYSYGYYRGSLLNSSKINNCEFVNTVGCGSTIELAGASTMTDCSFDGNKSVNSYLIYSKNQDVVVDNCQILNNTVSSPVVSSVGGTFNRILIKGNQTSHRLVELSDTALMKNCLICNNNCTASYDMVRLSKKSSVYNATIAGNESKSSLILYVDNSTLINSIVVGNKTANSQNGILGSNGANTISNNMLQATFLDGNKEGRLEYAAFNDFENGDYSLSENSYCINGGTDVDDALDLFGNTRKQGGAVDMGAIESAHAKSSSFNEVGEILYVKSEATGDGSSWKAPMGNIQQAIFAASLDGKKHQIWIASGTYYADSTLGNVVNLVKGISLYGGFAGNETSLAQRDTAKNPTILDGKGAKRVIRQTYGFPDSLSVVVDGFTIQNGLADNGAGLYLMAGTTVENCIVKGNKGSSYGSAINATGATIKNLQIIDNNYTSYLKYAVRLNNCVMDSCVIKNNKAHYNAGVYAENNSVITNCELEGNSAYYSNGSYTGSSFSNSKVTDCKFVNSTSGAPCVALSGKSVMTNCLFEGNTNVRNNIIYVDGEALVENCQILNNTSTSNFVYAKKGIVNRCSIKNNTTSSRFIELYNAKISNSIICNNICTSSNEPVYMTTNAHMENCTYVNNESKNQNILYLNNASLINSIFVGNTRATKYNGILRSEGKDTIINNMLESTFVDGNIDGSMTYAAFTDADNGDYSLSENSYCINGGVDLADSLDLFGNARNQAGAVDMGAIESAHKKIAFPTCGDIIYVKAGAEGDGSSWKSPLGDIQTAVIYASQDGKKHQVWVAAGTYYGDSIRSSVVNLASGISLYGGFAGTETSLAARDTAANPTILDGKSVKSLITQNFGFADSMAVVVDGFTIKNGMAVNGGGINVNANTTITNCIVKDNKASGLGSAIYASNATIKNTQIFDNTYTGNLSSTVRLNNCVMDSCVVKNNKSYYYAAIYAENKSSVSNCEIEGNASYSSNSGSYFNKSTVTNCRFVNTNGNGSSVEIQDSTVMSKCIFDGNTNVNTNLIYIGNSNALVEDCQILNNTTSSTLLRANQGTFNRCMISGNTATYRILELNTATSVLSNSLISANVCTNNYEPIYLNEGLICNCTVVSNETKHSRIVYIKNASLKNTIVVGNKKDTKYSGILSQDGTNTITNNMLESTFVDGNIDGSMEYAAFTDAENGDFSLLENSYCIDGGGDVAETLDFLGNARKQGGAVDMGAIESAHSKSPIAKCGEIIYVKAGSEGDGSSWKSPMGDIQKAILVASIDGKRHQVWVAAGTYYGDTTLTTVVNLARGIDLYGGFAGTETSLSSRDTAKNPTIIDGKSARRVISQNYGFADSMAVVIDGFTIQNGSAANGGGVNISTNTTINKCIIRKNMASGNGSAINASNATIKNTQIVDNEYLRSLEYTIWLNNCVMDSCVIKNNKSYYHGAIYAENNSKVTDCVVEANTSAYSVNGYKGSYFTSSKVDNCQFINTNGAGSSVELQGTAVMTNCLFEGNKNVNTQMIAIGNSNVLVEDCKIINNSFGSTILSSSYGKFNRCLIKENTTSGSLMELYYSPSAIANSLICNNIVTSTYEPFYLYSSASMINCTVVGNEFKHGNVVYLNNSTLKNSIVVGNKKSNMNSFSLNLNGTNTITNNMLESSFVEGNVDGSMAYAAFTDPDNGDYSLSDKSYCINAGAEVADSLDYYGEPRNQGGAVDMGAIESAHASAPAITCGEIVYVKSGSDGDGTSWKSAFGNVQDAIFAATADGKRHQVWVAAGTYYGDTTLYSVVNLAPGINLYGGFAGTETSIADRNTAKNPTILDGMGSRRAISNNSAFEDSMAVVVDGFTIQNGSAATGGGVYLKKNATLSNCIVKNCYSTEKGVAIYTNGGTISKTIICDNGIIDYSSSNPTGIVYLDNGVMDSCVVKNNKIYYNAIVRSESSKIINSTIERNECRSYHLVDLSKSTISDCKIINNNNQSNNNHLIVLESGSTAERCLIDSNNVNRNVLYVSSSTLSNSQITKCKSRSSNLINITNSAKVVNCTVTDNESGYQTISGNSGTQIVNSIVVGNKRSNNSESIYVNGTSITYSMIEGGANGEGNIDGSKSSAAFTNADKGNYSISATSLCINAGTDVEDSLDLRHNVRKQSEAVDMGAVESSFTERSSVGTVIYVKAGSKGDGTDWENAFGEINQAISIASSTGRQHDIWVAAGTYYGDTSLTSAISLSAGVNLYGGFAGTESSLDERDAEKNVTVIDGRYKRRCIIQNYDFADSMAIVVDGFTIQNGYMKSSAGVNAKTKKNSTFSNCIFRNAREGNEGVYAENSTFKNCTFKENIIQEIEIVNGIIDSCSFSDNKTSQSVKIVSVKNSKLLNSKISGITSNSGVIDASENSVISGCKIMNNVTAYDQVVYMSNSTLSNSYVCGNVASYSGCGIVCADYKSFVTNTTIAHNKTKNRSAVHYYWTSSKQFATVANCILFNNKVTDEIRPQVAASDYMKVISCASDGTLTGENNIKLSTSNSGSDETQNYVCFINAAGGDYRLHATSSCIDKGIDSLMTLATDINGAARIYGKAIDLGASEFDGEYVQMLDYSQTICHNRYSLEATFDSTISKIDWKITYAGNVGGFEETSGTGLTIPAMQLHTSKTSVDTLTLSVTPYDKSGKAGVQFNYNYFVYPDFSKKKVSFARPQVAYVVNEQNTNMSIEWNPLPVSVEVDNYNLYVWKASQDMPTTPMATYVKERSRNLTGLDNHTTYKYMVKAAIACDTISSEIDSFRIDIPVSLSVNGNVNCVFGSKLNETSSLTRYVKGFELTDSITYEIKGKDAADFSARFENGWDKFNGGNLRIYYTPTNVKKQNSDAEILIKSGNSGEHEITLYLEGTLSNYYVYDAVVAKDVYHAGDTVDVVGILTDAYGNPMSGKTLTIEANSNTGFTHSTTAVTDTAGNAFVKFATSTKECGTYSVSVYIGSKSNSSSFAKFDIPGMAYTGGTTQWTIQKGDTIDGTITITNKSVVDLHNLVVATRELADGLIVDFDTLKLLKGNESARIPFKATGTKLTEGKMYLASVFRVSCDENTNCDFSTYFYCEHPYGQIKVSPTDINEYVSKQKAKYISVELTNAGFGETGEITLSMPDFAGFSVPATTLPSIKSGDTTRFSLKLSYFAGAPINVPFTGSIGVNCANGKSTSLPFRIEYSSTSKGSLEVDVVDEYFYNTADKKHLSGATVVVRNQYNNKEVASGISDSTGIVSFDSIPEGTYLLSVKADKHSEYQETIVIQAGQKLDKFVFLAYQAITYTWNVERTEIEDKYDINLDLEYETNIPAPVVTLSFPNGVPSKDRFEVGVPKTVRLQITNHGLIAAHYVKFGLPQCPYYRFYAPYDYIDSLPANHTEFVPITIVRTTEEYPSAESDNGSGFGIPLDNETFGRSECPPVHAEYSYICGILRKLSKVVPGIWDCPTLEPIVNYTGTSSSWTPSYGGNTGSVYDGNVQNRNHAVATELPCNSCESKIDPWDCVGNVLGFIPGVGPVLSITEDVIHGAIKDAEEERTKALSCEVSSVDGDFFGDIDLDKPGDMLDAAREMDMYMYGYIPNKDLREGELLDQLNESTFGNLSKVQSVYQSSVMLRDYMDDPENFDMYRVVDFVYDQGKDIFDDKYGNIPVVKKVPWDCLDLICQINSCESGRYAENCGRYFVDWLSDKYGEDEDTRVALTDEGDQVVIENGQIKDIIYSDGTRLSEQGEKRSKKGAIESAKFNMSNSIYKTANSHQLAIHDVVEYTGFLQQRSRIFKEIAGSEDRLSQNGIIDYFDYTIKNYSRKKEIAIDSIKKLPTIDLSTTEMVEMAQRWNETLVANKNGVYSPNEEYPNIIDRNLVKAYMDSIVGFYNYMTLRGFGTTYDLLTSVNKEANKPSQKSICASVKLHIAQTLTMTREAFDGTLTVNNGNESGAMEGFKVVLEVRNEKGELSNDLFQINTEKLTGVTAVDGTGEIAPKSEGTALFRFIPEKGAAPNAPVNYSFGGYIVYVDPSSGDTVKADLYPVTLTVNPSPDLQIDYFMQRNILGDDALTLDRVEPSVPAALGVRIDNQGYGDAKNVKLETAQPEIVDNEKGLLIDFAIIGSSLNGKDCDLGSENINFGNIEPQSAKTGVWWMTSSLLGHFTKYEASVVHANSFGNPELSLVKGIAIHELIKTVDAYNVKEDGIVDFLVNDVNDDDDTPDAIYYSNGGVDTVNKAQRATVDKEKITSADTTVRLTVIPSKYGWNYAQLNDPGDNIYEIQKVVRVKDSVEIPLDNVWTTFVTLPDGADPIYVNRLHFLDYMSTLGENDYDLYYNVRKNLLKVTEITEVPTDVVAVLTPVDSVVVKFNRKIQDESFDYKDIELFCQGGDNLSDSTVAVKKLDDYRYSVDISSKTKTSGFYKIEVNVNNVYDIEGYPGEFGKNATWSQLIDDVQPADTIVTDTIVPINPDTIVTDTIVPINPDTVVTDTIVPINPDTIVTDTIVPINPDTIVTDTIVPINPDTIETDTIVPINPDTIVTDTIVPINPDTIVTDTIVPINPDTIVTDTIVPINPDTIVTDTIVPINPDTIVTDTIVPINPDTIVTDTIVPINPDTIVTDTIVPINPDTIVTDTIVPINPDTIATDTIVPINPDTIVTDTIVPINPDTIVTDTIVPINPDTIVTDTIVPINPDTIVTDTIIPINPDTIISDTTDRVIDIVDDEIIIYAYQNAVYVKSAIAGRLDIYDILSKLIVKDAPYDEGITQVAVLPKGVYIIKGKKIIIQ